tara:strand:+ start:8105 stop:8584 length:480 start_codon:yes stop_codon:yes gene_type:complete
MPYQDFAKFNLYELGNKTSCDTIVNDMLGHMTTPVNVASGANVNVGSSLVYCFNLPNVATASYDLTMPAGQSFKVMRVQTVKTGGSGNAGNNVIVTNGTGGNHVTEALTVNDAINIVSETAQVISANSTVAGGGTLRVTNTKGGGDSAVEVYVHGILSA